MSVDDSDILRAEVDRRTFVTTTVATGALVAAGAFTAALLNRGTLSPSVPLPGDGLLARSTPSVPSEDPTHELWEGVPALRVDLYPQAMTPPMLTHSTIPWLGVRALHDTETIAFHISWQDNEVDDIEAMARFRDAVAVQLPVVTGSNPPITMGGPGQGVHIIQWKASWQADIDHGRRTVRHAFPHGFNDVYPELLMSAEEAQVFYPGLHVANPIAVGGKDQPVEEAYAEGFGSLVTSPRQQAVGRGIRLAEGWAVVIGIPLAGDATHADLSVGDVTQVAFAAWNGADRNRGSRKHWGNWVELRLEGG